MTDAAFIEIILEKGIEAHDKVIAEFSASTSEQLNWKPAPAAWSIAECLHHLFVSDRLYFSDLEKIIAGNYKMSFWERYSPFSRFLGRSMKKWLQEEVKKKMKAPKIIQPSKSEMGAGFIQDYLTNLDNFLALISKCRHAELDKTIITSPIAGVVTYSLRDALQFLLQHEHRHINQAIRVKRNEHFPGQ